MNDKHLNDGEPAKKLVENKLLTPREFAERARVCTESVYRAVKRGSIKFLRVGGSIRLPESQLFLEVA